MNDDRSIQHMAAITTIISMPLAGEQGEIEWRFGPYFEIECITGSVDYSQWPAGQAVYLMTRK